MQQVFEVADDQTGLRVDVFLQNHLDASRSQINKMIKDSRLSINGQTSTKASLKVKSGDEITVEHLDLTKINNFDIEIITQTNDYLVINKPTGLLVHAKDGNDQEFTLVDFIREYVQDEDTIRPGIVHRLDRDTSGVIVVARHQQMKDCLVKQFQDQAVDKLYLAQIDQPLRSQKIVVDAPIARNHKLPTTFRVDPKGKPAKTSIEQDQNNPSLVWLKPETGRTHQLRVHLKHLNRPIVGDAFYGGKPADRLMLHAHQLTFKDIDSQEINVKAPIPNEFTKVGESHD